MFQFKFTCPQCHHEVTADESMCGSVAECPFCAKGIVVPRVNKTRDVVSTGKNLRLRDGASEPSEDPSATSILFASDERASATTYARGSEDKKPFGGIRRLVGTYPDPVTPKEQVPYSRPSQAAARNGSDSRHETLPSSSRDEERYIRNDFWMGFATGPIGVLCATFIDKRKGFWAAFFGWWTICHVIIILVTTRYTILVTSIARKGEVFEAIRWPLCIICVSLICAVFGYVKGRKGTWDKTV